MKGERQGARRRRWERDAKLVGKCREGMRERRENLGPVRATLG
jgi:hypothetical protein